MHAQQLLLQDEHLLLNPLELTSAALSASQKPTAGRRRGGAGALRLAPHGSAGRLRSLHAQM
eukprot:2578614-Prymnesium_polylepis.1